MFCERLRKEISGWDLAPWLLAAFPPFQAFLEKIRGIAPAHRGATRPDAFWHAGPDGMIPWKRARLGCLKGKQDERFKGARFGGTSPHLIRPNKNMPQHGSNNDCQSHKWAKHNVARRCPLKGRDQLSSAMRHLSTPSFQPSELAGGQTRHQQAAKTLDFESQKPEEGLHELAQSSCVAHHSNNPTNNSHHTIQLQKNLTYKPQPTN